MLVERVIKRVSKAKILNQMFSIVKLFQVSLIKTAWPFQSIFIQKQIVKQKGSLGR